MEMTTISIQKTSNPSILKFEADKFLTNHESFEFDTIDEAKASPLAQELFYLPFIKKVYISGNFVALERFDIVEWDDVQDEVAEQIANYINSGKQVVAESNSPKHSPITVYAESTPNPTALKFVINRRLTPTSYEFVSVENAKYSPLATELFRLPFVKSVFIDENFIAITKHDSADWNEITTELRDFLKNYIESGKEIIAANAPKVQKQSEEDSSVTFDNYDDISKEIITILEEYVKPAVANDGGNIEFRSYDPETKVVKVILQGACSGCPSSTFTLKNGIETMLKEMLKDNELTVEALNG
ncbi:Fe-S cluster biogenesis protein NfuA [Gelidibacter sediminis]|uniref:Fe-S cluster biogenesis protein NfuA n=1 Tax=Gelidibacter sediminis TaxID=1608710 RepID=A0A4R7Q899_9FLAO|nr:NifU family protein [Gelidibacter sediminis]TDU43808.1 Fe-S cluster biogenesis protein NfuA [Gelidibacter sediminis]